MFFFFFFFQAEDGIRDHCVTGVQTCALPISQRADEGKQTYEVQRGSIYDSIKALGRIVGSSESPLYFKQGGRLRSVNADVMQPVKKDDLLAELDTGDLKWRIETARLQMEIANV